MLTIFADISDLKYAMALCLAGRKIYTKCYQYIQIPFDTKLSTRHVERPSTIWRNPDSKITHRYTAANQVRAPDTALQSVVEDMKTIL